MPNHLVNRASSPAKVAFLTLCTLAQTPGIVRAAEVDGTTLPEALWFDPSRGWLLITVLTVSALVIICTTLSRFGRRVSIRPIAGLEAIREAVGRATEMGRPILVIPGIMDMNEIQTVAGLNILSKVARTAAEYETPIDVPTTRSLVMTSAREVVAAACLEAGKPELYDADRIQYVTDDQFGYVAEVCGRMQRNPPAACFLTGQFFAESLVLAEAGNAAGAIQIAGTAETSQLPFFVAACDYTLLGEELFAASAYLSGQPEQLGSLQGQDYGKLLAIAILLVGCGLATWVSLVPDASGVADALQFLRTTMLHKGES